MSYGRIPSSGGAGLGNYKTKNDRGGLQNNEQNDER